MTCEDPLSREKILEHLNAWIDADIAVANGQKYAIGSRSLERVDSEEIKKNIEYWRGMYQRICINGHLGPSVRRAIPHG
jgi:hypothetical protein